MESILDRYRPSEWSFTTGDEYKREIEPGTFEYRNVVRKVSASLPTKIYRIQNLYLYGQFLLAKELYEMEHPRTDVVRELYHCTSSAGLNGIVDRNFDYREVGRGKFGYGVSFSGCSVYARRWATDTDCIIIADVLIGNETDEGAWNGLRLPPKGTDTTTSGNSDVYVKYFDNEFYPKYAILY